jgi:hypothetical protein
MRLQASAAWAAAAILLSTTCPDARAQEAPKWSDVDCAQSHIVGPPGLKCRQTQVYSGGNSTKSTSAGAGGQSQHWSMSGTVNKAKVFYFMKEAVSQGSSIFPTALQEAVAEFSPVGKGAKDFSSPVPLGDGDYARFTDARNEACVAVRKNGPARTAGYRYYLLATKCVPGKQAISEAEAAELLSSFSARN